MPDLPDKDKLTEAAKKLASNDKVQETVRKAATKDNAMKIIGAYKKETGRKKIILAVAAVAVVIIVAVAAFLGLGVDGIKSLAGNTQTETTSSPAAVTEEYDDSAVYPEETTAYTYTSAAETTAYSKQYSFRNEERLSEHFQKHGAEVGAKTEEEYVAMANAVINNPDALTKTEQSESDGDTVYFIKSTGEIVFLSRQGIIRSYFIADQDYFERT